MIPPERVTSSDVRYAARLLALRSAVDVLEERYSMVPWSRSWRVRRFLLRIYARVLHDKTVQHDADQEEA